MARTSTTNEDQYSDKETAQRRDAVSSTAIGLSPSRSCAPAIGLGRLVSGHSAQYLSAMTPMAKPRNNKKNAHIQFGSNGTT
jgi:hypothetical protein